MPAVRTCTAADVVDLAQEYLLPLRLRVTQQQRRLRVQQLQLDVGERARARLLLLSRAAQLHATTSVCGVVLRRRG